MSIFRQLINGRAVGFQMVGSRNIGSVIGSGLVINGNVVGAPDLPEADSIEVIALDKHGKRLDSFKLKADTNLVLNLTAPSIKKVKLTVGDLTVMHSEKIDTLSTASGDIHIQECTEINNAKTISGDVKVANCSRLGKAHTMSGNVKVDRNVSRGRDASPTRKSKKK